MKILKGAGTKLFLLIPWMTLISEVSCIRVDLYLNKDKFGEFLRMDISEKGCTNVPLNWDNQAYSLDTHGSCVKFYDLPYCRGKYVALQPYHGTFQDNLETLGFKHLISSASPCGPKVPSGRYYILNGADGSVLTVDKRNGTVATRTMPFKPYITKNQQYQIDKISLADYEIIPRVHEDLNPLTFDMSLSTRLHPVRRTWKIESVYRGKYVIKNEWNNRCLYKSESGKVEEHECVAWSPNQEWMFKSIKVQPFFPSKEELNKKPIRPDEQLPFHPQQDISPFANFYPHPPHLAARPGMPLGKPEIVNKNKKPQSDFPPVKLNKPFTRPNPIVINPREPFPPVQPHAIYPKGTLLLPPIGPDGKPDRTKAPIPFVQHPGRPPFPAEPLVTDPRKPLWPPALFGAFGPSPPTTTTTAAPKKKKNSEEEDEEEEEEKEEDEKENDDDKEDEEKEEEKDTPEKEEDDDKQSIEERGQEGNVEEREEDDREDDDTSKEQDEGGYSGGDRDEE